MPKLRKRHKPLKIKVHTQKYWKHQLDPLMSKLVREKEFCERCGRTNTSFDWSHVVGRKNLTLRWDIINALCLCFQCHKFFWHEEPLESGEWFRNKYPHRYNYLMITKDIILHRTEEDYLKLKEAIVNKDLDSLHLPLAKLK